MKVNIIIPIGGIGERFKKEGYLFPKPLIKILGKEVIFWLIDNLNHELIDNIIIPYNNELLQYNFEDTLRKKYPKLQFLFFILEKQTEGAAETLLKQIEYLEDNNHEEILKKNTMCLDCDNFYSTDIIKLYLESETKNIVYNFRDVQSDPIFSYVKLEGDRITNIVEKEKISDLANTGCYCFKDLLILKKYCQELISNQDKVKNEYYTSSVIKRMLNDNIIFKSIQIPKKCFISLGTPLQAKIFMNNIPKHTAFNKDNEIVIDTYRFCFDLDNTLVTFPKKNGDYRSVEPLERNIAILRYLKKMGHYIIIQTARRMRTHRGNQGKLLADIGRITFDTLERFDIPYDEIYFGKPDADFYIDDKAVNSLLSVEKEIGFFEQKLIEPRYFNQLEKSSIETIIKKSDTDKLKGEIYWYTNIPNKVKDIFPLLLRYGDNWYEMEKITGITISHLYLQEELKEDTLFHILGSIRRVHLSVDNKHIANSTEKKIYDNYREKLVKRYENYDYSIIPEHKRIYDNLLKFFDEYERNRNARVGIIHGDPVFTNILLNQFNKLKFIDMRGILLEEVSMYGDIFYDYAKIYQSLLGYDEKVLNKVLNRYYKQKLIKFFEEYIRKEFDDITLNNIRAITYSLIFTLLPLHHGEPHFYRLLDLLTENNFLLSIE
jgi:capsule biosynthesis phosphatase